MSLVVCSYGGGTNSTAMLIELARRGERVDLILFADTGGERPETYEYIELFNKWLIENNMPEITIVNQKVTLEQDCLNRKALPSLAYGFKTCSQRFKIQPQDKFMNNWQPSKDLWKAKERVIKLVGYDAGEPHRVKDYSDKKYILKYPLVEWDWWRSDCEEAIKEVGLPLPGKSSCFFCPSMRKPEIFQLKKDHPDLIKRAIALEENADLTSIPGLGRSYSWKSLIDADERQVKLFCDITDDMPCGCYDG